MGEVRINFAGFDYARTTADGSTLVTNVTLHMPPSIAQRHHVDSAFRCPGLRAVYYTAASYARTLRAEDDATDASFSDGELTAVGTPQQVETRFPSRIRVHC